MLERALTFRKGACPKMVWLAPSTTGSLDVFWNVPVPGMLQFGFWFFVSTFTLFGCLSKSAFIICFLKVCLILERSVSLAGRAAGTYLIHIFAYSNTKLNYSFRVSFEYKPVFLQREVYLLFIWILVFIYSNNFLFCHYS